MHNEHRTKNRGGSRVVPASRAGKRVPTSRWCIAYRQRTRRGWLDGALTALPTVLLMAVPLWVGSVRADAPNGQNAWEPVGLSGGGGMFSPAISPADPDLMMLNCDMSAAYLSEDGGRNWRMIHHAQLRSDTRCRPGVSSYGSAR